jgi:hypothetical protein
MITAHNMKILSTEGYFFKVSLGSLGAKQRNEQSCLILMYLCSACVVIMLQIELTPVDFVSRVIVGLLQDVLHSGSKIFHIINPSSMNCW